MKESRGSRDGESRERDDDDRPALIDRPRGSSARHAIWVQAFHLCKILFRPRELARTRAPIKFRESEQQQQDEDDEDDDDGDDDE